MGEEKTVAQRGYPLSLPGAESVPIAEAGLQDVLVTSAL